MMSKLTETLQKNPIIILIMFIISIIGGLITILLGWNQFYEDYLSKQISIPVWMVFIIMILGSILLTIKRDFIKKTKGLETVEGQYFGIQQVYLDGKRFVNCKFDGSELIFKGEQGFSLEKNKFLSPPRFTFSHYAAETLTVIKALNKSPEFKEVIKITLDT